MKFPICSLAVSASILMGANTAISQEMNIVSFEPNSTVEMVNPETNFYPLHAGWLQNKSVGNNAISLGDRSQWRIDPDTVDVIADWEVGDPMVVSPNFTPLSPFPYWIRNARTDKSVLANLYIGSEEFGKNSHWIAYVDKVNQRLFLENRVGFEVDHRDREPFSKWEYKDTIIIGMSNTWFTPYDYILINTTRNQHVRVKIY